MLRTFKALGFICLILFSTALCGAVNQNGDFQIWNHIGLEFQAPRSIWDKVGLKCSKPTGILGLRLNGEARLGNDAKELYLVYAQGQVFYANECCELAPGFRQTFDVTPLRIIPVYMPLMDLTFFYKLGTWKADDRNRVFYNIPENAPEFYVYRNRFRLISPEFTSCLKLRWFIFDEVFFLEKVGFHQNRLASGLFLALNSHTDGTLQYIYRSLKVLDTWTYQNILFLQLSFRF